MPTRVPVGSGTLTRSQVGLGLLCRLQAAGPVARTVVASGYEQYTNLCLSSGARAFARKDESCGVSTTAVSSELTGRSRP